MHLSYSKLRAYLSCPLKYKFCYIDKLPQRGKPYLRFSHIIHTTLSRYHFYHRKNLRGLLDYYRKAFLSSSEKSGRLYEEGKRILIDFYQDCQDTTLYRVEERFKVRLGSHILSGKIDRVDRQDGGYEIIDYKTGKRVPSEDEVKANLQLRVYSAAFYKLAKLVPLRASLYYLRHRKKLSLVPTEEDIQETIKLICSVGGKIRGKRFPSKKGAHCRICDYRGRCSTHTNIQFSKQVESSPQLKFGF